MSSKTHLMELPEDGIQPGQLVTVAGPKMRRNHVRVGQVLTDRNALLVRSVDAETGAMVVSCQGGVVKRAVYQYVDMKVSAADGE